MTQNYKILITEYLTIRKLQLSVILFSCFLILPKLNQAQSLAVGTPVLEDAYRRAQLLGQVDSSISFTSGPLFPVESMNVTNAFDPTNELENQRWMKFDGTVHFAGKWGKVQLLPIIWKQQTNTHHPYSLNDGAMIPARGYQTLLTGGIFAKFGPLSIQLQPELVYAKNKNFEGFSNEQTDQVWYEYYEMLNFIDLPEKFGSKPYNKTSWGQSSIRLTFGPASIGLSNENLWWGPGMRNSLVMSNSADGFEHLTLNTVKPVRTPIGSFEGQIISGYLQNSGFTPPDTNRAYLHNKLYFAKKDEKRYINGMVLSYQPKWIPGLFVGITRSFTKYESEKDSSFRTLFPIFYPLDKKYEYENKKGYDFSDQRASVFLRWLWQKQNAEVYFEMMREDHAHNWRDLMLQLEYSRAYIFGLRKLIPLNRHEGQYIQVGLELTQLEQTNANPRMPYKYLYISRETTQGYTNNGQPLGAGIGPGSNMQTLSVSWVKSLKMIGVQLERYIHNNDFHNAAIKDIRGNWVDMSLTGIVEWDWHNLIFSARFEGIKSFNYQHKYTPIPSDPPQFWDPGRNVYNFQAQFGINYRF